MHEREENNYFLEKSSHQRKAGILHMIGGVLKNKEPLDSFQDVFYLEMSSFKFLIPDAI